MDGVFCAFIVTYNKMVVNGFIFQNAKKQARMVIFFVLFTLLCIDIFRKMRYNRYMEISSRDRRNVSLHTGAGSK